MTLACVSYAITKESRATVSAFSLTSKGRVLYHSGEAVLRRMSSAMNRGAPKQLDFSGRGISLNPKSALSTSAKQDGRKVYQSKSFRLGATNAKHADLIRSKDDARGKAAEILKPLTSANGAMPRTDMTVGRYIEEKILPWWDRKLVNGALKPSTVYGYRKIWRLYLLPKMENVIHGSVTMGQAGRFLDGFAMAGLNSNCVSHIRNVASEIFAHAATSEVITANPFAGAKMLESAKAPEPTHTSTVWPRFAPFCLR